jgi:hypothetical protein
MEWRPEQSGVEAWMRAMVGWKVIGDDNEIYLMKYKPITV